MKDLKAWLQKRTLSKKESDSAVNSPQSLQELLSSLDIETKLSLESYLCKNKDISLTQIEAFIKDPNFLQSIYKNESKFYQNFIKEKYLNYAKDLCKSLYYLSAEDLQKALNPKDFAEKIGTSVDPNGKNIVSHKDQMKQFPVHGEYTKMLKDPFEFKAQNFDEGISAKIIHKIHGYTDEGGDFVDYGNPEKHAYFMAKPYHPLNDDADLTDFPLHGWATMTTKALFNSGGIGHLCEDVSVHEHNNTPITVHKFNTQADTVDAKQYDDHGTDPLQIHQIGVMDYLSNNLDRHNRNLMMYKDKTQKHHLLAVDHERNFAYRDSYEDHDYDIPETPFGYSSVRGLQAAWSGAAPWQSHKPLADWWLKNGMNIQKEFAKQTASIHDPAIRKHVYDNFIHRWERMDDWAKLVKENKAYNATNIEDMFEPAQIKQFKQPINQKILDALPKNPRDAVSALFDVANRKSSLTRAEASQVKEALSEIVKKMNPKQLAGVYKDSLEQPNWQVYSSKSIPNLRSIILDHLLKPEEYHKNKPLYKLNHIKEIADTIDSLPEEHEMGVIQKEQAKKLRKLISKVTRKAA